MIRLVQLLLLFFITFFLSVLAKYVTLKLLKLNCARIVTVDKFEVRVHHLAFNRYLEFGDHVRRFVKGEGSRARHIKVLEDLFQSLRIVVRFRKDLGFNFTS